MHYCLQVIQEVDFFNPDDVRTFCTGECVGRFVDYISICPDDENAGNINSLISSQYIR